MSIKFAETLKSRCLFWLCGIHSDKKPGNQTTDEDAEGSQRDMTSIEQSTRGTIVVNVAAIACLTLVTALFGFFY